MSTTVLAAPAGDRPAAAPSPAPAGAPPPTGGFVALSRFVVANGMAAEVREAFRRRPHRVDAAPGFVRMDVICPLDRPEEFWLLTTWADEASFRAWHHGHSYRDSHRGIPKGLKLLGRETELRGFEHVGS